MAAVKMYFGGDAGLFFLFDLFYEIKGIRSIAVISKCFA